MNEYGKWIKNQNWEEIQSLETAHQKAEKLQSMLLAQLDIYLPEKTLKVNENDLPWVNFQVKKYDRQQKREYSKNKRSNKWKHLNKVYRQKSDEAKENYYSNIVEDLKTSNVGKWYSKLKRMSCGHRSQCDKVNVQSLSNLAADTQAEKIADSFAFISNEYEPLKSEEIDVNQATNRKPFPWITPDQIHQKIKKMKSKTSTVINDIPWKIIKEYGFYLSYPLEDIFNRSVQHGDW